MDKEVNEEQQAGRDNQEKNQQPVPNGKKTPKFNINWLYGIIAIILLGFMFMSPMDGRDTIEVAPSRFWNEMVSNHDVYRVVVVNHERVEIFIKPENLARPAMPMLIKTVNAPLSTLNRSITSQ